MDSGIYDKALLPDIAAYSAAFQHPTRDTLDVMMAKRKMSVTELSERVEITMANISILKNGKARAISLPTRRKDNPEGPPEILNYFSAALDKTKHAKIYYFSVDSTG